MSARRSRRAFSTSLRYCASTTTPPAIRERHDHRTQPNYKIADSAKRNGTEGNETKDGRERLVRFSLAVSACADIGLAGEKPERFLFLFFYPTEKIKVYYFYIFLLVKVLKGQRDESVDRTAGLEER